MNARVQIAEMLRNATGLDATSLGPTALRHALRTRLAACKLKDEEAYLLRLQESPEELQELIETVVVPETWFFRDSGAFDALASVVTYEWLPRNPARALRILSVPCSTGEEAYSISISLLSAGVAPDRFRVVGADISHRALKVANAAIYGRNSFRREDLDYRDRHFRRRGDRYEVHPDVRSTVSFRHANLLHAEFAERAEPYDVVFCRNVLIYFDHRSQDLVVQNLRRVLAEDGLLFVGPAEPFLLRQHGFRSIAQPFAFAFRKTGAPAKVPPLWQFPPPGRRTRGANSLSRHPLTAAKRATAPAKTSAVQPLSDLQLATSLADAGRLAEAAQVCQKSLREHGPSAACYYLLALVHDAMGLEPDACECYRKTIYLDPNHFDALMHLALLAQKSGDLAAAHRYQVRAQRVHEGVRK